MAQILKLRRSAIPGAMPTTASLNLGELALNTYDGKVYMKRSGSAGEEIIPVGATSGSFSGSFTGSFIGDGNGLYNIPASGIVGLNLSQIATGSVTASVSTTDPVFKVGIGSFTPLVLNTDGLIISGSIQATQGITGSLEGTASWARNAITSSYAANATSASYSITASYADNFTVNGLLVAQTILVQTVTSSIQYVTGSTKFGDRSSDTHQFTGSVYITGSLAVNGVDYTATSASFNTRILNNSSSISLLSSSFLEASASLYSRILTNSASIDLLSGSYVVDSASFDSRILGTSGSLSALSASYYTDSGSFDTRITNNSSSISLLSSSFLEASASLYSRILVNSGSIDTLSGSYTAASASFDIRITNISGAVSLLTSSYIASSASFDDRILNISGSLLSLSGSYFDASASFNNRILNNSGSIALLSGSYIASSQSFDSRILGTSSSLSLLSSSYTSFVAVYNTGSFLGAFTGSLEGTASWARNAISSSYAVTAAFSDTASYVNPLRQDVIITGSLSISSSVSDVGLYANADTIIFTGSVYNLGNISMTGSLSVLGGITGSLFGTASYAISASYIDGGYY